MKYDVLVIGGGPASSTVTSLLKVYDPSLKILVVEREKFPRDHIGESQLNAIPYILNEMRVWEKVEEANFPMKVGSTYRWGKTDELWQVNFLRPGEELEEQVRPGKFEGQRKRIAFQVDRSIYDEILLDHTASLGCEVREETKALSIKKEGDRVLSIAIEGPDGTQEEIEARYYIDASGGSGFLRRQMGVEIECPTSLRNVALYQYWCDTDWAETVGGGGTRAQILSIGWGWIWFIPITSTRTSIGVVTPAAYLKASGKTPQELYYEGLAAEPRVTNLLDRATKEDKFYTTKDWSYIADRLTGENWFLAGDACGFADPILSAGMTLAMVGSRKLAYTIIELERGKLDPQWLKDEYSRSHKANILQHIRFGEFWYAGNGQFTDLNDYCAQIAQDAGLKLTPEDAFQWIGTGGFAADTFGGIAGVFTRFQSSRNVIGRMLEVPEWTASKTNVFCLDLKGVAVEKTAFYKDGGIIPVDCLRRGDIVLPLLNQNRLLLDLLQQSTDATTINEKLQAFLLSKPDLFPNPKGSWLEAMEALETMISQGWIRAEYDPTRPVIPPWK